MDITELMRQKADDAAESAERDKRQPDQADLASRIAAYLNNELSASEMDKLSKGHGPLIDAEIQRREQAAQRKKELDEKNALRIFNGIYTEREEADARQACSEVRQKHPILRIVKYQLMLLGEVASRKQFVTVPNLEAAYQSLRAEGAFEEPIEPVQSAEQYRKEHSEDWPAPEVPPLISQRIEKFLATFKSANPQYILSPKNSAKMMDGILKSGSTISLPLIQAVYEDLSARGELELNNTQTGAVVTVTDLGGRSQGFPKESEKYSLKMKIRSMTADQIAQRCADDPAFERALNNLK
jgi:hypothetical protein